MSEESTANAASMGEKVIGFFQSGQWLEALIPFATSLVIAFAIFIIGFFVVGKIISVISKMMDMRKMDEALQGFLLAIIATLLKAVVILIAVEQLGMDTTSLLAILGAAGLAIGLALKDSLSNFAAGVMLIMFKPFKIGDFVEAGGAAGIVEKITVFNSIFRSGDNKEIIIPNGHIYGGTIVNYSAKPTRRIDLVMGIGYGDDMKKAREIMLEVINNDERVLKNPEPVVAVHELADSSVNFVVRPWVKTGDYWPTYWALTENIKDAFDKNGISIPFPQQDVHMHAVNTSD